MALDKQIIGEAARKYGVDPKILWGLYGTETSFGKNTSRSSAGAVGPFQFEPATAKGMGVNPYDFKSAAFGAARYLSQYKSRGVGGMLSAYNAGPAGGYQSGYVNTTLQNAKTYGGGGGIPIPKAGQAPSQGKPAEAPQQASQPTFNQAAYNKASSDAMLGRLLKGVGNSDALVGLLGTKEPNKAEFMQPGTPKAAEAPQTPSQATPSGKGYVNPLPGFTKGRTDMGVDYSAKPGQSIKALGDAKILNIRPNWYAGQPYLSYELLSGPQRGKIVYVAEQISPTVRPGQTVRAGEQIGVYAQKGTGIETGFGTKGWQTQAQATSGYSEGQQTAAGQAFQHFVDSIETPQGKVVKTPHGPVYVPRR